MRPEQEPKQAHDNYGKRCTTLFFEDGESADFYMRGSVCWPMSWPDGEDTEISGHALISGQDIETKEITIFKEHPFVSVSNILNDGRIEYPGLESFFNHAWSRYFLRHFFWHGNEVTTKQWRLEVLRNDMIMPKPYLINVEWHDDSQAIMQMWRGFNMDQINFKVIGRKAILIKQLSRMKKGEKEMLPAVQSLMSLISGINRYPWRG